MQKRENVWDVFHLRHPHISVEWTFGLHCALKREVVVLWNFNNDEKLVKIDLRLISFKVLHKMTPITICHGDFQSHNLMFRVDSNGQVGNKLVSIIDWQLVFYGLFFIVNI